MSLFGTSPTDDNPALGSSSGPTRGGSAGLFDDDVPSRPSSNSLFADDDGPHGSPWGMPSPRKPQSRADLIRHLLPASDVPDTYIETFDTVLREDGNNGRVTAGGIAKLFATARLGADAQARIMSLVAPGGGDVTLDRNEFNVLLALAGLAQEGEVISLDGVDERRRREYFFYTCLCLFSGSTMSFSDTNKPPRPRRFALLSSGPCHITSVLACPPVGGDTTCPANNSFHHRPPTTQACRPYCRARPASSC